MVGTEGMGCVVGLAKQRWQVGGWQGKEASNVYAGETVKCCRVHSGYRSQGPMRNPGAK